MTDLAMYILIPLVKLGHPDLLDLFEHSIGQL